MFTQDGDDEYRKYEKWISDADFQFSPNFIPTPDTPAEAVEYYKGIYRAMLPGIDFDSPDFRWPTGVGLNC